MKAGLALGRGGTRVPWARSPRMPNVHSKNAKLNSVNKRKLRNFFFAEVAFATKTFFLA